MRNSIFAGNPGPSLTLTSDEISLVLKKMLSFGSVSWWGKSRIILDTNLRDFSYWKCSSFCILYPNFSQEKGATTLFTIL